MEAGPDLPFGKMPRSHSERGAGLRRKARLGAANPTQGAGRPGPASANLLRPVAAGHSCANGRSPESAVAGKSHRPAAICEKLSVNHAVLIFAGATRVDWS